MLSEKAATLLSDYLTRITHKDFVESIFALEVEKQFPFSLLNDLRGYINYAPSYFHSFAELLLNPRFDCEDPIQMLPLFGLPTRMQRYALTLFVLGAYLDRDCDKRRKIAAVNKLVDLIVINKAEFSKLTESIATDAVSRYKAAKRLPDDADKLKHAQLSIALREYVDFLFLGEHLIGCEIADPITINGNTVVSRHFFNLGLYSHIDTRSEVRLIQVYDSTDAPHLYGFRGRLDNVGGYKSIKFCYHEMAGLGNEDDASSDLLINDIVDAMRKLRTKYQRQSEGQLELDKMRIYSLELSRVHQYLNGDPYSIADSVQQTILNATISTEKALEHRTTSYSHLFFTLLIAGLRSLLARDAKTSEYTS